MKVLILGGTGMLGSMVAKVLPDEWEVLVTARTPAPYPYELVNTRWRRFDAYDLDQLLELADGCNWIVNCIGATKPLLPDEGLASTKAAVDANVVLPVAVAAAARQVGCRVLQVTTDCVYRGVRGNYSQYDEKDATDLYGRTKALGEAQSPHVMWIRTSIVGPECRFPARHLLGRVIEGAVSVGYTAHYWNGVTTLALAKVFIAAMDGRIPFQSGPAVHLVSDGKTDKCTLVRSIALEFSLSVAIHSMPGPSIVDRTLACSSEKNEMMWLAAGYTKWPSATALVNELAEFCRREQWPPSGVDGWRHWRQ